MGHESIRVNLKYEILTFKIMSTNILKYFAPHTLQNLPVRWYLDQNIVHRCLMEFGLALIDEKSIWKSNPWKHNLKLDPARSWMYLDSIWGPCDQEAAQASFAGLGQRSGLGHASIDGSKCPQCRTEEKLSFNVVILIRIDFATMSISDIEDRERMKRETSTLVGDPKMY